MEGDASCQLPFVLRQQEPAVGWGIMARKPRKFFLEILEAKIDPERLRVFQKKFARLCNVRGRLRLHQCESGNCPSYPMSMPPLTLST